MGQAMGKIICGCQRGEIIANELNAGTAKNAPDLARRSTFLKQGN
jgi:hypothetical protein